MRMSKANKLAPLPSLEKPPAANYATGRSSSPASLTDVRVHLSVAAAEEATSLGRAEWLGHLRTRHGPPFLRAGPTVAEFYFLILFCFIISHICIDIQKYVFPSI